MSKKLLYTLLTLFLSVLSLFAQTGEWQQKVAYEMDITMHPDEHEFDGYQKLTYFNNSPDTLYTAFYHLYFNAFNPNSMMAERNRNLPDPDGRVVPKIFNLTPEEVGYHNVKTLKQDGKSVTFEITDTILKVNLAKPIPPNTSTTFEMTFHSQVPLQTRRSGRDSAEGVDFSMSQWYPKMANYDQRGWHTDFYIGREFYAPFGTFDVKITIPRSFVLGGTGVIQNPNDVGYGYGEKQSSADSLQWHFKAENVHDFAWVADTEYIHQIATMEDGRPIHLLFLPEVAKVWEQFTPISPRIIKGLGELFGAYPHPQFTIAQAGDGGMEYPMIIFNTGRRSIGSLVGVSVHEGAHQWFYSMFGSNETEDAWMDEGFTSYATTEVMGRYFSNQENPSHQGAYQGIFASRRLGWGEPISSPSDWFDTNAAYGVAAYSGGQFIAEMLGYVISEPLRDKFFKEYYRQFRFKHPEPHDVELVAEKVSGLQLDWFFYQWLETMWKCDYAIAKLENHKEGNAWKTTVHLKREGRAVMPIDLKITIADGSEKWVNIPLSDMLGHKPVPDDWTVAKPWEWTFEDYTLTLDLPAEATYAEIDPLGGMLDENRLNNTSERLPKNVSVWKAPQASLQRYGLAWSPFATYSNLFGVGIGTGLKGNYVFNDRVLDAEASIYTTAASDYTVEEGLDALPLFNYDINYRRALDSWGKGTQLGVGTSSLLGIAQDYAELSHPVKSLLGGDGMLSLRLQNQDRIGNTAFQGTASKMWNSSNLISGILTYRMQKDQDFLQTSLEAGNTIDNAQAFTSGLNLQIKTQKAFDLGKRKGYLRGFYGAGSNALVQQKHYSPGLASLEGQWQNDAYRVIAGALENPADSKFFAFSGVGPVGYLAEKSANYYNGLQGDNRLLAASLILDSGNLGNRRSVVFPLSVNIFAGYALNFGAINSYLADAGIGVNYNVAQVFKLQRWTQQSDVLNSLNFAFKMPLWISESYTNENVKFRWLMGIETGF